MALDFPSSPSAGQKYPTSPVVGVPTYTWDGEKWSTLGAPVPGNDVVRYDTAQTLTATQQQQARQNIYGAPFNSMAYGGLQINGAMEVSQFVGTSNVTVNNTTTYVLDGWLVALLASGATGNAAQIASTLSGFPFMLSFNTTSGMALATSTDAQYIWQYIEGYRWARLAFGTASAQPVTISFWVFPGVSGTMAVSIRNGAVNRSYVADVAVTGGAWNYKTVTIPGDVTGSWYTSTNIGAAISFCFGTASAWRASAANTWVATQSIATTATTNFFSAANAYVYLTGVTVFPGNEGPSSARSPSLTRPYGEELATCQRYFWIRRYPGSNYWGPVIHAYATNAASGKLYDFPVTMRASPTYGYSGSFAMTQANGTSSAVVAGTIAATPDFAYASGLGGTGMSVGQATIVSSTGAAYHAFDARL